MDRARAAAPLPRRQSRTAGRSLLAGRIAVVRRLGCGIAVLGLPGILWTLYQLLRATPWAGQPMLSLLGQGTGTLLLVLDLIGVGLAFRTPRRGGTLLLSVGLAMLLGAVSGRTWDAPHWAGVFVAALVALILPALVAGTLLLLALGPVPDPAR